MTKRSANGPADRLLKMHDQLLKAYGPQYWWPAQTPFEVIVGAYLTQNTSWKAVEVSLRALREAGALTVDGLRALSLQELTQLIRPSGFYNRKAPALQAFIAMLDSDFDGSLEKMATASTDDLRKRLLELPGVGPETADAILLYAFHHPVPVADEYLRRIVVRHQLINPAPKKNRQGYMTLVQLTRNAFSRVPKSDQARLFNEFHALAVAVGKAHCGRVPDCSLCPLSSDLNLSKNSR